MMRKGSRWHTGYRCQRYTSWQNKSQNGKCGFSGEGRRAQALSQEVLEEIAKTIDEQLDHIGGDRRKIRLAGWNRDGTAENPCHGVSPEKEDDPRLRTGASPMCGPREKNGVDLRRKHRRLIWFFWMKVKSISIWPDVMGVEREAARGRSYAAEHPEIHYNPIFYPPGWRNGFYDFSRGNNGR